MFRVSIIRQKLLLKSINYIPIINLCYRINRMYRRKAVAKDWFGNGEEITIGGKLEFIQESTYDVTDVEVSLEGLGAKMSGYHVHEVITIQYNYTELFFIFRRNKCYNKTLN